MAERGAPDPRLAPTARLVLALNLSYFGVEAAVGLTIGSVAVLADSIDFLEDASVNLLILVSLAWAARRGAGSGARVAPRLGMGLATLLLVPSVAAFAMAWHRFVHPALPDPATVSVTGLGALLVNGSCALLMARLDQGTSLVRAAYLSARNDVLANLAIIAVGPLVAATRSNLPDLFVGLGIALLNAGAAWEVFELARRERRAEREAGK